MKDFKLPRETEASKTPIGIVDMSNVHEFERVLMQVTTGFQVSDSDRSIATVNINDSGLEAMTNFLIFPTAEIYNLDRDKQELIGYRIRCERKTKKGKLERVSMNVTNEELNDNSWLKRVEFQKLKLNMNTINLFEIVQKLAERIEVRRRVFTSSVGWVLGEDGFQYVPWSYSGSVTFLSTNSKKFQMKIDQEISDEQAFSSVYKLLDVATSGVTFPLLSFTILSTLSSLIKPNKIKPEFILNLYGDNGQTKEVLSNLFCNLYNRSKHVYSIDSRIHANQILKSEIPDKVKILRDGVFIGRVEKEGEVKAYLNLLHSNLTNGLLLLSTSSVVQDNVFSINIGSEKLDNELIRIHQSNPAILSTWFSSFIGFIRKEFQKEMIGLGSENYFDKFYSDCKKTIEEKDANYDVNKLRHMTWLFLGFVLFIEHGRKVDAIDTHNAQDLIKRSITVFRNHCILGSVSENQGDVNNDITDLLMTDSLKFIHAIDHLLLHEKLYKRINPAKDGNIGWIDQEEQKIYLKNTDSIKKIEAYLLSINYKLGHKKNDIYKFLFAKGIIPEKGENGWGIQLHQGSKAVVYDSQAMKAWLLEHHYKLAFLSEKSV